MNTSETASPTHTELHQRAAELTALLEVTRQLAATRNLQDLLSLAAQQIVTVTGVRGCALLRRDEDGATVTVWVEHRRLFPEQAAPAGTRYALTDFPAARRVLETGEPVVLSADDPRTHLAEADYMRHRRASDMLLLPLPVRGRRIGLVMMDDANRQKFTDVEIRLCQIVVEQVAIAIENARLYEETDRLRAFNQNIVQSLGEGIVVEDESGIITFANPTAAEMLNYQPKEMVGLHWRNIVAPEAIPRVEKESAKRPHGRASRYETICITRTGARVPVIVSARPLFQGEHFTGVLAVFRDITDRKRDEEVLQQRNRQLELLYRAGQVFMSTLNLDEVLATVLEEVRRLLDVVACSVWLVDRKTGELVCRQVTNPQGDVVRGWRLPPGKGLAGWVAQHGQTLNVPDVQHEPRHFKGVDEKTGLSLRSILTVPLRAKGETIGVIQVVDATVSRFNRDDQMLVESLAAAAARAIENARLYEQTQRLAILEERERFARDLHDGIIQSIYAVGLALDQARADITADNEIARQQIDLSLKSLARVIQDLRNYIFDLRPQALKHHGLKARLEGLIAEVKANTPLPISVEISPNLNAYLHEWQANHLFHICHEALSNAIRHAKPRYIAVRLIAQDSVVTLSVEDDGVGFAPPSTIQPGHRGLSNIQSRVAKLGATLTLDSAPGRGTRLTVQLPFAPLSLDSSAQAEQQ